MFSQAPPTEERRKAREELSKLREATVKHKDSVSFSILTYPNILTSILRCLSVYRL